MKSSDALATGMRYHTFNLIDDYNREALPIEVDVSLTAERIIRVLEQVGHQHTGGPGYLRLDNGPEFTSNVLQTWATHAGITIQYIAPGKSTQNGFIERCNGNYCNDVLDVCAFTRLDQVRRETERWIPDYNLHRPHESLGDIPPIEFL